jgi:hypothetical protein
MKAELFNLLSRHSGIFAAALLISGFASVSAEATVIMTTYDFSATAFQNMTFGSTALPPVTMVTGSITLTIDSTGGVRRTARGDQWSGQRCQCSAPGDRVFR